MSALEDAGVKEEHKRSEFKITFPYMASNDVMKIVKSEDIDIVEKVFDNSCLLKLSFREDFSDRIIKRLLSIDGVTEGN